MNEFAGIFFELTEKQLNKLVKIVETFIHLTINELNSYDNTEKDIIRIISNIREATEFKESLLECELEELSNEDFGYKLIIEPEFRCIARDILKDDILDCQERLQLNPELKFNDEDPFSESLLDRYLPNDTLAYKLYQIDYEFLKQIFNTVCQYIGMDENISEHYRLADIYEALNF